MLYTMKECDFILRQLSPEGLTEWEILFAKSLRLHRAAGKTLTDKQVETLSRIWEKQS